MSKLAVSTQLKKYCEIKGVKYGPVSEAITWMLLASLYTSRSEDKAKKMSQAACLLDYVFTAGMSCMHSLLNTTPFEGLIQSDIDFDTHMALVAAEKEYQAFARKIMLAILGFTPWPKDVRKPSLKKYKDLLDLMNETIRRAHNKAVFHFSGHGEWGKFMSDTWEKKQR